MSKRNPSYYETLGVKPGAKHTEIGLAYNRLMAARRRDSAPPDLKLETRLQEAFAVLSDLDRRAAYDEALRAARLKPAFGKTQGALAALFAAGVAAAAWWFVRPEPPPPVGKPVQEIADGAFPAVGRLTSMDISGEARPVGLAFAVGEGVLVTSCQGLSPTAQLAVELARRKVPARIASTDEALGLCKLEAPGVGTWPLPVSGVAAKANDPVYALGLDATGGVRLAPGKVRRVARDGGRDLLDATVAPAAGSDGAPLLDVHGQVVAVASTPPQGKGTWVALPAAWVEPPPPPPPRPAAPEPEAGAPPAEAAPPPVPGGVDISPERRERLEKAFRPPPTVPDDI